MVRAYTSSQSTQPPDLYSFLEHPDVLVLDVRSREEYDVGHIGMMASANSLEGGELLACSCTQISPMPCICWLADYLVHVQGHPSIYPYTSFRRD